MSQHLFLVLEQQLTHCQGKGHEQPKITILETHYPDMNRNNVALADV